MPRIRSIKPEFWDSPGTIAASLRGRLLYIAMWNWADDYGIGDGNLPRLISFAFPGDDVPAADLPQLSAEMSDRFGVVWFLHEGRPYYWIPSWEKHQRTEKKARQRVPFPEVGKPAPDQGRGKSDASGGSSFPPRGSSGVGTRGTGEQGELGELEEQGEIPSSPLREEERRRRRRRRSGRRRRRGRRSRFSPQLPPRTEPKKPRGRKTYPEAFERFWAAYPRKDDKADAAKAWETHVPAEDADAVIAGAARYAADPNRAPGYTKLPGTWLRAGSWENGPLPPRAETQQQKLQSSRGETLAALERMGVA
jgi:hypothetical protein